VTDHDQLRLTPELLTVMRAAAGNAVRRGAHVVAPSDLLLALLYDPLVGPALATLVRPEEIANAAEDAEKKLPEIAEIPEGVLPDGEHPPFVRYDSLAFLSPDGTRTLYLDGHAYHLFIEGARRADEQYRPKHLVLGFTAEAVKDRDLLKMFGVDPAHVANAVYNL
jgi:hypothetical protein